MEQQEVSLLGGLKHVVIKDSNESELVAIFLESDFSHLRQQKFNCGKWFFQCNILGVLTRPVEILILFQWYEILVLFYSHGISAFVSIS